MAVNILSALHHVVEKGARMKLRNKVFPYPPFSYYSWAPSCSISIHMEKTQEPSWSDHKEGGSIVQYVTFTFSQVGTYSVAITDAEHTSLIHIRVIDRLDSIGRPSPNPMESTEPR